jgi:hypothetical protein
MTLEWAETNAGVWINLGSLHPVDDGYVIFHTPYPGSDPVAPCYLPADLTLDEAKSAAKLILAIGGEHGQR